jgi:predicted DNA-binding transcriptional regulator AlpA
MSGVSNASGAIDSTRRTTALTERQVAEQLGLSVATLRAWRHRGKGPRFLRLGRSARYLPSDVEEFVRANAVDTQSDSSSDDDSELGDCTYEPLETRSPVLDGLHGQRPSLSQAPEHDESSARRDTPRARDDRRGWTRPAAEQERDEPSRHSAERFSNRSRSAHARTRRSLGHTEPGRYLWPACQWGRYDPTKPMLQWDTAWRALRDGAGLHGLRFHDLRHTVITELAEMGVADHVLESISGHLSRRMLEHYSHIRIDAKRQALDALDAARRSTAHNGDGNGDGADQAEIVTVTSQFGFARIPACR